MQARRAGTIGNQRGNAYIQGLHCTLAPRAWPYSRTITHTRPSSTSLALDPWAPLLYIGGLSDSSSLPSREALRGKLVVFRNGATGASLGAPDLSPNSRLGLIAGIAVTHKDELLTSYDQYLRTLHLAIRKARALPSDLTQPSTLFLPTRTVARLFGKPMESLRPGDTAPALEGEISFEPTDLPATKLIKRSRTRTRRVVSRSNG
jgi:hypothetical protein